MTQPAVSQQGARAPQTFGPHSLQACRQRSISASWDDQLNLRLCVGLPRVQVRKQYASVDVHKMKTVEVGCQSC